MRVIVDCFFFFKQKTAYEMRISDCSSDVCSSDLALPEDMLTELAECGDSRPVTAAEAHPSAGQMARVKAMLEKAERPMMIVGGSGWSEAVREQEIGRASCRGSVCQ